MARPRLAHSCSIPDCFNKYDARGLCKTHYGRWVRYGDPLAQLKNNVGTPEEKFWRCVKKTDTCWMWTGSVKVGGYGTITIGGKVVTAHRLSFYLHNGHYPSPMCLHSCDNRRCVNPAHLREGTQKENVADMYERQRESRQRGYKNGMTKFTEEQVRDIRNRIANGEPQHKIGADYGIRQAYISAIHTKRVWAWLE